MPIAVRTLFFAAYRDLVGRSSMDVELPEGSSVGDLVAALRGSGVGVEYLALTDWVHGADVATVPSGRDEAPGRGE